MVVKMLSEYWAALLIGAAAGFVVGVVTLLLLGFRRVHRGDRTLIVPQLDRRSLRERLRGWRDRAAASPLGPRAFWAIVALMAVAVVAGEVQNTRFNLHQRDCNADFVSTTLELRQIGALDRELENRDDALRNTRDDLLSAAFKAFVEPPPAVDPQANAQRLVQEYNAAVAQLDIQRNQLIAERADLERQRQAQPAPKERC